MVRCVAMLNRFPGEAEVDHEKSQSKLLVSELRLQHGSYREKNRIDNNNAVTFRLEYFSYYIFDQL